MEAKKSKPLVLHRDGDPGKTLCGLSIRACLRLAAPPPGMYRKKECDRCNARQVQKESGRGN